MHKIAASHGVGTGTVQRIAKESESSCHIANRDEQSKTRHN
jgi:hypothetical protein